MINEEEFTKFDIEEKIKLFQNGIEILKQSIKTEKSSIKSCFNYWGKYGWYFNDRRNKAISWRN